LRIKNWARQHKYIHCNVIKNSQEVWTALMSTMDEKINKMCPIHITLYYLTFKKGHPVTCYSVDEPWVLYAKWNKPLTKR
jgi:hypothetical protein